MGKQAPSAPDPYQAAQAQEQFGTEAAEYNKALNATNETGPTGSTSNKIIGWDPTTGAPLWGQTTTLTAPEQGLLTGEQTGGAAEQNLGLTTLQQTPTNPLINVGAGTIPQLQTRLDTSNVPGLPSMSQIEGIQGNATNAIEQAGEASLNPLMTQEQEQLHASLVNSGNGPGTPAYENAMAAFNAQAGGQYAQLAGAAATGGAQVGQTEYGEMAGANQQGFTEDLQRLTAENQAAGMNETDALQAAQAQIAQRTGVAGLAANLYASAAPSIPSASGLPTAQVAAPNFMQALQNQYQGQLASYNANVGTTDSLIGDAAMIAAAMA